MKKIFVNPINTFLILFIFLILLFFLLPINIFDGEIIYQQELVTMKEKRPLSLHFVAGLEYAKTELKGIKEYHLLGKGYLMAFLFIVGIPAIVAYRVNLGFKNKKENLKQ